MHFHRLKRREFITLVGGAAAWPLAARAQQPAMPVVGFLSAMLSGDAAATLMEPFDLGLNEAGYFKGRNVAIEYFHEGRQLDHLPEVARELANRPVSLITAMGTIPALAAKNATGAVPIVFVTGDDPVARGLVISLNRPAGNITGVTFVSSALAAKRLQFLRSIAPQAKLIGLLSDTASPESQNQSSEAEAAARNVGQRLVVRSAATDEDIDGAFATFVQEQVGALLIAGGPFLASRVARLVALTAHHAIPTMYTFREFVIAGGLMSYGASFADAMRQTGRYVGRILRGEKPSNLPVVQPTKFELVINVKAAKALGIELSPMVLVAADEVIE
jgi:putative ABC transport system substrate-binding protein